MPSLTGECIVAATVEAAERASPGLRRSLAPSLRYAWRSSLRGRWRRGRRLRLAALGQNRRPMSLILLARADTDGTWQHAGRMRGTHTGRRLPAESGHGAGEALHRQPAGRATRLTSRHDTVHGSASSGREGVQAIGVVAELWLQSCGCGASSRGCHPSVDATARCSQVRHATAFTICTLHNPNRSHGVFYASFDIIAGRRPSIGPAAVTALGPHCSLHRARILRAPSCRAPNGSHTFSQLALVALG